VQLISKRWHLGSTVNKVRDYLYISFLPWFEALRVVNDDTIILREAEGRIDIVHSGSPV
jgi:hypothetical protein